ncbi:hypothetical protein LZZ85_19260 [Terrimonas sp. NA20]|uniref:Uncharacterized protein n=1 Tax=Terrimonas ginsenosidimutans TaxID=2908004 RepID=A0ABS9KVS8_9BACT|nr:hypothetical protein [Terrimonas ginsenosidimutans]MCG2616447.1 hypothetical protein [Terrimonas ginsenosidimutans]
MMNKQASAVSPTLLPGFLQTQGHTPGMEFYGKDSLTGLAGKRIYPGSDLYFASS